MYSSGCWCFFRGNEVTTVLAISALRRSTRWILSWGRGRGLVANYWWYQGHLWILLWLLFLLVVNEAKFGLFGMHLFLQAFWLVKPIKPKVDTTKNHDQFCGIKFTSTSCALGWIFPSTFPCCQGIVKKIVAEPRPGSTTLRRSGMGPAPMNGRKQIGYLRWTKTVPSTL